MERQLVNAKRDKNTLLKDIFSLFTLLRGEEGVVKAFQVKIVGGK